jgi:hypothetical protein
MGKTLPVALSVFALVVPAAATMGVLAATGSAASASARSADLAVSGAVAGGERTIESSHPVVFVFTMRNRGPGDVDSSADLGYVSVRNGTVTDQLCVFSTGASFNADSPQCEYGALGVGQAGRMTLVVQPRTDVTDFLVSVKVCSSNESGIHDPVASNDCVTRSVRAF